MMRKEMFWTALSRFHWRKVKRTPHADSLLVNIDKIYILNIVSFNLVYRGL